MGSPFICTIELAEYNYNELGQLVKKYLHGNGSSAHLQGINYRYNIRDLHHLRYIYEAYNENSF